MVPVPVLEILNRLEAAGHEAVLVGGCVRDLLLGRPVHDYDIATSARPEQVKSVFPRTADTGIQHGTVTVLYGDAAVEVTTYRIDLSYSDGRRPDAVVYTDRLTADLARRDFTINAIAMRKSGELVDPFDGQGDLVRGQIRAVGRASDRFVEDGLRILRAIRFAAELGFAIDAQTLRAMEAAAVRLRRIAAERIGQELRKTLTAKWWHVADLLSDGPWLRVLGEPMSTLAESLARLRLDRVLDRVIAWHESTPDAELAFSASVALCASYTAMPADTVRRLFRAARWPNHGRTRIANAAELVNEPMEEWGESTWRQMLFAYGFDAVITAAIVRSWRVGTSDELPDRARAYAETQPLWRVADLTINGRVLLSFGLSGPAVGAALTAMSQSVLTGDVKNEPGPLMNWLLTWLKKREQNGGSQ